MIKNTVLHQTSSCISVSLDLKVIYKSAIIIIIIIINT